MFDWLPWKITPKMHAAKELGECELALLKAHSAKEYAQSVITFNTASIKRLKEYLAEEPVVETTKEAV